ncbi:Conserved protein [Lactobacillus equicursoris 66c]|uniref:Conserved protein n=1 Tax=Lactobacillus equicursoris 66c TaxID=872326 RepID=K0NUR5_9LACO|nr:hypothetical protein [Lactobacillus equicursoris]CCK83035.1 Conserved protein [Lactobacillus equicursoris 66c]
MEYVILLVVGLLLIVGGVFAFKQTQKYLTLKTSSNDYSNNQWWGFALWGGYIGAGILSLVGAILIIVSVISML